MNKLNARIISFKTAQSVAFVKLEVLDSRDLSVDSSLDSRLDSQDSSDSSLDSRDSSVNLNADSSAIFSAFILDFTQILKIDSPCRVVFKESEVMICDKNYTRISARNRFISRISRIETDEIFARIHFEFHGANLSALISREAKEDLNLRENEEIAWFVKSSEVALEF